MLFSFILTFLVVSITHASVIRSPQPHPLLALGSENVTIECNYLVQIMPGKNAKKHHFAFLSTQSHLMDGVREKWQIGQTFQGYYMNLCDTVEETEESSNEVEAQTTFVQQLQSQYHLLQSAPYLVAVEKDQIVSQTGWVHNGLLQDASSNVGKSPLDDEISTLRKEQSNEDINEDHENHENHSYYKINGQQMGTVACQSDATWSLHRVANKNAKVPLNNEDLSYPFSYVYEPEVRPLVYIMDTQVWTQHPQFAGRAETVQSYVNDLNDTTKPFPPHGTHVTGLVGAARYGVQKWAHLLSVVTLNRAGQGSFGNVLNGATWIAADAAKRASPLPAVVNLSLAGGKSTVVNAAMDALVDAGLVVVVAVGNSHVDACTQSPASATKPVKVAASDSKDQFASFSNWGTCVDIIAPGVIIQSSAPYNKMITMSGTSMSSPLVAGIIASALANGDLSAAQARNNYQLKYFLNQRGLKDKIGNVPQNTNNLLVQTTNTPASQCGDQLSDDKDKELLTFQLQ